MSGTAAVGNTFASAVTATGLQLDNNFSTIVAYLNDPTNRNNYAADAGATNTVVTTFAPPVAGGYTAGLELTWKWAATPTGGTVLNANGLGNISVVNPDGSALQSGQGTQGGIGKGVYDGTRVIFITPPSPATKAQAQTATASATFLTPAIARFLPGEAQAWVQFTGTNSVVINASYNVAGVARLGQGAYVVTFSTPFLSANYACALSAAEPGAARFIFGPNEAPSTATFLIQVTNQAPSNTDAAFVSAVFWGKLS